MAGILLNKNNVLIKLKFCAKLKFKLITTVKCIEVTIVKYNYIELEVPYLNIT